MPRSDHRFSLNPVSRAMVRDDRDQRVPLVALRTLRAKGLSEMESRAMWRAAWRGIPVEEWVRFIGVACVQAFIVYLAAKSTSYMLNSPYAQPGDWLAPAMVIACCLLMIPSLWLGLRHQHAGSLAKEYLRAGKCASCGYALENLTPQGDGCTVCPECGAAWKLDAPASDGANSSAPEGK